MTAFEPIFEGSTPRPWVVEGNSIMTTHPSDDPYVVEEVAELASDARLPTDSDAALIVRAVNEYEALLNIAALVKDMVDDEYLRDVETHTEAAELLAAWKATR